MGKKKQTNKKQTNKEINDSVKDDKISEDVVKTKKFINNKQDVKIRLDYEKDFKWISVRTGEIVSIPEKIALANGLEEI